MQRAWAAKFLCSAGTGESEYGSRRRPATDTHRKRHGQTAPSRAGPLAAWTAVGGSSPDLNGRWPAFPLRGAGLSARCVRSPGRAGNARRPPEPAQPRQSRRAGKLASGEVPLHHQGRWARPRQCNASVRHAGRGGQAFSRSCGATPCGRSCAVAQGDLPANGSPGHAP